MDQIDGILWEYKSASSEKGKINAFEEIIYKLVKEINELKEKTSEIDDLASRLDDLE